MIKIKIGLKLNSSHSHLPNLSQSTSNQSERFTRCSVSTIHKSSLQVTPMSDSSGRQWWLGICERVRRAGDRALRNTRNHAPRARGTPIC